MYKDKYLNFFKIDEHTKNVRVVADATKGSFGKSEKIQSIWKKHLLRIANSDNLHEILNGKEVLEELLEVLANFYSQMSQFRLTSDNCLMIKGRAETLKIASMGEKIVPLFSPNLINIYDMGEIVENRDSIKPDIDTNFEPGYFEYNYDNLFMINSSYALIYNPDPITGRVVSTEKIKQIRDALLKKKSVLIVESSLGNLLPDLVYSDDTNSLVEGVIYIFNLSATGLADEELNVVISNDIVISRLKEFMENDALKPNKSDSLMLKLLSLGLQSKDLGSLFKNWFKGETQSRLNIVKDGLIESLSYSYPIFVHKVDGGNSLWINFKNLPLGDIAVANLLKSQGLLVNPGSFFFPDHLRNWSHSKECIHLNISGCAGKELEVVEIMKKVMSKCYIGSTRHKD